jgi:hypothetical protein
MSAFQTSTAVILPFVRHTRSSNRMTLRDRMAAMEWHNGARARGYTRIAHESPATDDEAELGDFMLIYTADKQWAVWGIGCCDGGFIVWRPSDGVTLSWHPTIARALATIPAAEPDI